MEKIRPLDFSIQQGKLNNMEEGAKEVTIQVQPEKKTLLQKAAEKAKAFVKNLNPIGKDKAWFAGLVTGTAESILVSPLLPFPVGAWAKAGINALVATGVYAAVDKFYDIKDKMIRRGSASEVQARIDANSEKRLKAAQRVKSFFGGVAAGTILGLGAQIGGVSASEIGSNIKDAVPSTGEIGDAISSAAGTVGEAATSVAGTVGEAATSVGGAVVDVGGSAAESVSDFVSDKVVPVAEDAPGFIADQASTGEEAVKSGAETVASTASDLATGAYDKAGDLYDSASGPASDAANTVADAAVSAGETIADTTSTVAGTVAESAETAGNAVKDFVVDEAAPTVSDAAGTAAGVLGDAVSAAGEVSLRAFDTAVETVNTPTGRAVAAAGLGAGAVGVLVTKHRNGSAR